MNHPRTKYGNVKVELDGHKFDSKREARRYQDLKLMEKVHQISNLVVHPRWRIFIKGQEICDYIGDFEYEIDGCIVVEDTKGFRTAVYRIKKKLMKAAYGIEIVEI